MVGYSLLAARDWGIPDDGNCVAIALQDVSVNAVECGGNLAIWKPGVARMVYTIAQLLPKPLQRSGWAFVPM